MLKVLSNILYFLGILNVLIVFPGLWISDGFSTAYINLIVGVFLILLTFLIDKFSQYREKKGTLTKDYGKKIYWYLGAFVMLCLTVASIVNEGYP
ncbi:hypothetical protein [Jejuia pallidilutea]|nr:hypothetical protein [Jejuia pallidilutea]